MQDREIVLAILHGLRHSCAARRRVRKGGGSIEGRRGVPVGGKFGTNPGTNRVGAVAGACGGVIICDNLYPGNVVLIYPGKGYVLYYGGKTLTVEWFYTEAGRLPGLEHYRAMGELEQERLDYMVRYLADAPPGTRLPMMMYRLEDAKHKIYAFKPRAERFFNFITAGRMVILTNAYRKHSQQMGRKDLVIMRTAIEYRTSYLRRVQEGTYYEQD